MNFSVFPPEINSRLMFSGAGSGPMLEAAAAWEGLASELSSAASSFGSVTAGLAGQAWQGPAAAAMMGAAAPYSQWLGAAAAEAAGAAGQARAVASAFETARAAIVHPLMVELNRNSLVRAVVSNWFGLNAPAIAALESDYEQMWARDVSAMFGYHGEASIAAAQLAPAQSLQDLLLTLPNLGIGNLGNANLGNGNTGSGNVGSGNVGDSNVGGGNIGSSNFGFGNGSINPDGPTDTFKSNGNIGAGNIGNSNFGLGNAGNNNVGVGNNGSGNYGGGNTGTRNIGGGNNGHGNIGFGEHRHRQHRHWAHRRSSGWHQPCGPAELWQRKLRIR